MDARDHRLILVLYSLYIALGSKFKKNKSRKLKPESSSQLINIRNCTLIYVEQTVCDLSEIL